MDITERKTGAYDWKELEHQKFLVYTTIKLVRTKV